MFRFNWDRANTLPKDYRIRSAHPADLAQLCELLLTSFYPERRFNPWLYPLMRLGIQEDIKRRLNTSPHQYGCLVVVNQAAGAAATPNVAVESRATGGPGRFGETGGASRAEIVGTLEISLRSQFWQPLQPRRPYIANVAVDYHHRRRGLAQQMLIACESIAKTWGYRQLYLHVATDNLWAIALYQKTGYQVCGKSPWRRRQMMVKELFF
ncbi:GNAT family N-acetyltransferase [Leptothoe sp. PORK10 BA2]|uniref:GNAT family N-acetyltransferase n=1 Tax=Leptothoe sp. PORK10 BA2 TaxID=3110254 RepID=UPI002B201A2F|nr:GNAT family N-acetyltransferase [Leptothoe sp. PORK10 BA2]MEA5462259.1 GNAT family N-acetyltransferase [Leptothoe sp. PORK10 BA2]